MLTADAVREVRVRRAKVNHETYKQLYEGVCKRIKSRVQYHPDQTSMWHQVPPLVVGRPIYNHDHAVRYIDEKLRHHGFRVVQVGHGMHIDWTPVRRPSPPPPPPPPPGPVPTMPKRSNSKKFRWVKSGGASSKPKSLTDQARDVQASLAKLKSKLSK